MSTRRGPFSSELSVETRLPIDAREECGKPCRNLFHRTELYKEISSVGAFGIDIA